MSTLSYGLNLTKKASSSGPRQVQAKRKPIFGDDDSDAEDGKQDAVEEDVGGGILDPSGGSKKPSSVSVKKPSPFTSTKPPSRKESRPGSNSNTSALYGDLSATHSSNKHAKEAASLDSTIYDYDAVYDSLHASKNKKSAADAGADAARAPKYIGSLLAAAEVRKKDQLRAQEKLLMKEREAEGDEFADKEKFVTGAYKAQQEETRRLEEEERLREEEEGKKRAKLGMQGFYKNLLDRDEKRHDEVVKAAQEAAEKGPGEEVADEEKEKTAEELARELNKDHAGRVMLNDEGQVVDKRQLLSAGLNVAPKPKASASTSRANAPRSNIPQGYQGRVGSQKAMRERQTRMLEAQLEQQAKRAAEDEAEEQSALQKAAKSTKSESDISSARERYLQRKKEAAGAAAGEKGS